jgi:CO/xanthine dehydrogenase FAD-binding subunit
LGPLWQKYIRPASLGEALQALSSAPGPACPIAGGTDLMLDLRQGRHLPLHTLVDISGITDLLALEERGAELWIGAAVPINQILNSPLICQHAQALAEACDLIGGPQVRNVATLGGNVAHALPAADGAIALLALDAYAVVAELGPKSSAEALTTNPLVVGALAPQSAAAHNLSPLVAGALAPQNAAAHNTNPLVEGALAPQSAETPAVNLREHHTEILLQKVPLLDLYLGPGKTALKTGQILVGFSLPRAGGRQGSAFQRVMCAQGVALPVLNMAVWLVRDAEQIADVRIAVGPAGPTPRRAPAAEAALRGRRLTADTLVAAETALLAEVHFRTSPQRATAEYRRHLAGKILAEAVHTAWERAA